MSVWDVALIALGVGLLGLTAFLMRPEDHVDHDRPDQLGSTRQEEADSDDRCRTHSR